MKQSIVVPPAPELRYTTVIPRSTVQDLRDLRYFGSNILKEWKTDYKKDFRFYQNSELIYPDDLPLRRKTEAILKEETAPIPKSENQAKFGPKHPVERTDDFVKLNKSTESEPNVFKGDPRLISFTTSSHENHHAREIKKRVAVDKIAKFDQSKSFSLAEQPMTKEHFRPKNMVDYPKYAASDVPTRRTSHVPCEIVPVLQEQPEAKFAGRTTTSEAFVAYGEKELADASRKPILPNYTPKTALFTDTHEPPENSECHSKFKPLSAKDTETSKPTLVKDLQHHDSNKLFHKDPRTDSLTTTNHGAFRPPASDYNRRLDQNGKIQYDFIYDDMVGKDIKMEKWHIPRHLHQQSMTKDYFQRWDKEAYQAPTRNYSSFYSTIPMGLEDSPAAEILTTQRSSFPAHPSCRRDAIPPGPGGIRTMLPLGAPMQVRESEVHSHFKPWDIDRPAAGVRYKDMQTTSMIEPKHGLDYGTTNRLAYPSFPVDPAVAIKPERDRNPILNDSSSWRRESPYLKTTF